MFISFDNITILKSISILSVVISTEYLFASFLPIFEKKNFKRILKGFQDRKLIRV